MLLSLGLHAADAKLEKEIKSLQQEKADTEEFLADAKKGSDPKKVELYQKGLDIVNRTLAARLAAKKTQDDKAAADEVAAVAAEVAADKAKSDARKAAKVKAAEEVAKAAAAKQEPKKTLKVESEIEKMLSEIDKRIPELAEAEIMNAEANKLEDDKELVDLEAKAGPLGALVRLRHNDNPRTQMLLISNMYLDVYKDEIRYSKWKKIAHLDKCMRESVGDSKFRNVFIDNPKLISRLIRPTTTLKDSTILVQKEIADAAFAKFKAQQRP